MSNQNCSSSLMISVRTTAGTFCSEEPRSQQGSTARLPGAPAQCQELLTQKTQVHWSCGTAQPRRAGGQEARPLAPSGSQLLCAPSLHGEAPTYSGLRDTHYSHCTVCVVRIYNRAYRCHIMKLYT